tara:strand:- start:1319 stop:1732 length:414 start_codon:yes stop_codon:yes gene_type:complete
LRKKKCEGSWDLKPEIAQLVELLIVAQKVPRSIRGFRRADLKSQDFIKSPYNFSYGDAVKRAWSYGVRVALQPLKLAIGVRVPVGPKFLCSPMARISLFHREDRGSIPRIGNANLAQSVERAPFKRVAVGSIPTVGK